MGKKSTEEKIREIAKGVADAAEPIFGDMVEGIRTKAEPVAKDLINKAEPVAKDLFSKAEPMAKDIVTRTEPVLNIVKEKAAPATKKATEAAKAVGENISQIAARGTAKEEIFVQYGQHEIRTTDIMEKAKEDFVSKGNKLSDIKEIQVYIKPSDNAAYYVVNHSETGKIET